MEKVTIRVNRYKRIVIYPLGGLDIEIRVDGQGWILANDSLTTDAEIDVLLQKAIVLLSRARIKLD